MGPASSIGYLLQHLSWVLSKRSDQMLQENLDMGFSQFKILRVLQHHPKTRQRQIAEWLGQTEASISRQIKLMIEKGLLQTTISPENRREHLTTPTAKGLRMTEAAMRVLTTCHAAIYADLGHEKQRQLLEILTQMHASACNSANDHACHPPFQPKSNII